MRALIYARVSSDPRGLGRSVAEQEVDCRAVAAREGWDVTTVLVDNDRGASRHSTGSRPAFDQLSQAVSAGECDVLLTWEASRFQRDLAVYVELRELCRVAGVQWSYSGRTYDLSRTDDRLTTGLDALLAERESDLTRERVRRAMTSAAVAGRPHGRPLYGYTRTPGSGNNADSQEIEPGHADVIREAARRVAGGEALTAVAADFNRRGIPSPGGLRWELTQIRRLVSNPAYVGQRVHRGKIVGPANWPAIIDDETFWSTVSRLSDPGRKTSRPGAVKHLLTGLATCGVCGGRIGSQKNRGGYRAYLCRVNFCVSRKESDVDDFIGAVMAARLAQPDVLDVDEKSGTSGTSAARGQVAELKARLEGFYDAAAAGEVTPVALARIEARLMPEIEAAEAKALGTWRISSAPALRAAAGSPWDALAVTVKRELISVLATVRILPTRPGARTFDPTRIEIVWR
jgi:site-specific DNA recombinase